MILHKSSVKLCLCDEIISHINRSPQNILNFFLATFSQTTFSEIAWHLLICIFAPKFQAIFIIFRAEHIYISLSGLSIKRSGKKKFVYALSPTPFVNVEIFNAHSACFLLTNIKFWRKVPCIFLLSLPKHGTRA